MRAEKRARARGFLSRPQDVINILTVFVQAVRGEKKSMAIRIKPVETLKEKYANRASAAGADYKAGIDNPRRDQAAAAVAAKDSYASGVQQAIADDRFARGVTEAGTEKWKRKAGGVGAQRYPQGASAAKDDWARGSKPILDAIGSVDLPPRGPRGTPQNIQRVVAVAEAARKASGK
jgi:hypothetical protein